jgi:hypothetical protein
MVVARMFFRVFTSEKIVMIYAGLILKTIIRAKILTGFIQS